MSGRRVNFGGSPPGGSRSSRNAGDSGVGSSSSEASSRPADLNRPLTAWEIHDLWNNLPELQEQYRKLWADRLEIKEKLNVASRDLKDADVQLDQQLKRNDVLIDDKQRLLRRAKDAETKVEDLKARVEDLRNEIKQQRLTDQELREQNNSMRKTCKEQEERYKSLEAKVARLRAERDQARNENESLRSTPSPIMTGAMLDTSPPSSAGSSKPHRSSSRREKDRLKTRFDRENDAASNAAVISPSVSSSSSRPPPRSRHQSVHEHFGSGAQTRPSVQVTTTPVMVNPNPNPIQAGMMYGTYSASSQYPPVMSPTTQPIFSPVSVPRTVHPSVSVPVPAEPRSTGNPNGEDGNYHRYPLPPTSSRKEHRRG